MVDDPVTKGQHGQYEAGGMVKKLFYTGESDTLVLNIPGTPNTIRDAIGRAKVTSSVSA
jgi:hypothetical protein